VDRIQECGLSFAQLFIRITNCTSIRFPVFVTLELTIAVSSQNDTVFFYSTLSLPLLLFPTSRHAHSTTTPFIRFKCHIKFYAYCALVVAILIVDLYVSFTSQDKNKRRKRKKIPQTSHLIRSVVKTFDSIRPIDCINIENALISPL